MPSRETLQTIRDWAISTFPDEFAKFEAHVKATRLTFSQFSTRADDSSPKVHGLKVGTVHENGAAVYAWKGPDSIRIGHEIDDYNVEPHVDITTSRISFLDPFSWVHPAEDEVGLARFEALVRYISLTHSPNKVVKKSISSFKEHLKGACHEITEHLASRANEIPTPSPTPTPTPITPSAPRILRSSRLAPAPPRPQTPNSPGLANDQHLRNIDQAFSSARASILAQVGAAQATSRRETAAMQSQIHDLQLALQAAETSKQDLSSKSTELRAKVSDLELDLLSAEQAKTAMEVEHAALTTKNRELEAKAQGAQRQSKKECDALRVKMAAGEAKTRAAEKDAEMWKTKWQELKGHTAVAFNALKKAE